MDGEPESILDIKQKSIYDKILLKNKNFLVESNDKVLVIGDEFWCQFDVKTLKLSKIDSENPLDWVYNSISMS